MLNKLSYNLMNSLNEAEEIEIKKTSYTENTYLNENCKEELTEEIETSEDKEAIEERLASLKTQLEVDGDQLADDEKAALQNEIAELENQLAEDEVDDKIMNEEQLNETGEWDDNDEEMAAWKEDLRGKAEELAKEVNGECKIVKGFDKYQGPFAIVATPKHGDIEVWFDGEDDTGLSLRAKVAHKGWIEGGVIQLAELLNLDEIPEDQVLTESEKLEEAETDAIAKLKAGDEVFFRDEGGQALMGHYAEAYEDPEEYDEGYKPENGGSEEALAAAKEAAENREVWEFIVADDAGQPLGEVYTLCYGEKELADFLTHIREVKKVTRLEEAYSERYGGDPEDFINDVMNIKRGLLAIDAEALATHLAKEMLTGFMETCENQIDMVQNKLKTEPLMQEAEEEPAPRKLTREEWNKEFGPGADPDIINAGREPENRVELVEEAIDGTEEQIAQAREDSIEKGLVSESEEAKDIEPIAEAEVKGLKEVKSQGNIYMLEDETNKFIVGENYVESEGLIENAEIYDNKEDADKDYLGRCEITGGEEA